MQRTRAHKGKHVLNETLVDAHLEAVPGLGTLTARGLAGGDLEGLGGQADGAGDAEVLGLGALDELGRDLLEGLDLAGGEGDADLVRLGRLAEVLVLVVRHFCGVERLVLGLIDGGELGENWSFTTRTLVAAK